MYEPIVKVGDSHDPIKCACCGDTSMYVIVLGSQTEEFTSTTSIYMCKECLRKIKEGISEKYTRD